MGELLQSALPGLVLPPLALVLLAMVAGLLAWRGARWAGMVVVMAMLVLVVLSTPWAAGWLFVSLEAGIVDDPTRPEPRAIIILSAEAVQNGQRLEPGALTLERLRAGARLHRRTGLPVLVSGGMTRYGGSSLAEIMARSLQEDFGITARWLETRSRDTHENAVFSAEMLRADGIGSAWLVTHGWHLARAQEAFARLQFPTRPEPVRIDGLPPADLTSWIPRPDYAARSWFALREWLGRLVYALRDGH